MVSITNKKKSIYSYQKIVALVGIMCGCFCVMTVFVLKDLAPRCNYPCGRDTIDHFENGRFQIGKIVYVNKDGTQRNTEALFDLQKGNIGIVDDIVKWKIDKKDKLLYLLDYYDHFYQVNLQSGHVDGPLDFMELSSEQKIKANTLRK